MPIDIYAYWDVEPPQVVEPEPAPVPEAVAEPVYQWDPQDPVYQWNPDEPQYYPKGCFESSPWTNLGQKLKLGGVRISH